MINRLSKYVNIKENLIVIRIIKPSAVGLLKNEMGVYQDRLKSCP